MASDSNLLAIDRLPEFNAFSEFLISHLFKKICK